MNIILIGPPGSGKGTQNKFIQEKYGMLPISTGDMFRSAISSKTAIGLKAKTFMDKGQLVPDEVTVDVVKERLAKKDFSKGFILDGFPRTLNQAEVLDSMLKDLNLKLDKVVFIDVDENLIVERLVGRRTCRKCAEIFNTTQIGERKDCPSCKGELYIRSDDTEAVIRNRFVEYNKQTLPLRDYYTKKGLIVICNGQGTPEQIFNNISHKLNLA